MIDLLRMIFDGFIDFNYTFSPFAERKTILEESKY